MLKHATLNRTNRAQQTLQLHKQWQQQQKNQPSLASNPLRQEISLLAEGEDIIQNQTSAACTKNDEQQQSLVSQETTLAQLVVQQQHLLSSVQQLNSLDCKESSPISLESSGLDVTDSANQTLTYYHSPSPQPPPSNLLCNLPLKPSALPATPPSNYTTTSNNWLTIPNSLPPSSLAQTTSSVDTNSNASTSHQAEAAPLATLPPSKCSSESMIKVFAQSLSQDVEYVTLHVDTQTKSQQIIKSLLRKFRLKHRDPNLFYLTLERWIRKDGLKFKSVMLLGDEASPLQLQQCCSNPPHNDIKFTLQMRAGSLVKIYCSDVVPDARYKCLSLSTQTTAEETIELMLHCLNLSATTNIATNTSSTTNHNHHSNHLLRSSNSPISTSSSVSSSCSTSSGIESDSNHHQLHQQGTSLLETNALDSESRTSSVTSISSSSNISSVSSSNAEHYCLIIECIEKSYERIIESDEYLVDVYQNLLTDAKGHISTTPSSSTTVINSHVIATNGITTTSQSLPSTPSKQQPLSSEQFFSIKLKKRKDCRISQQSHSHLDQQVIKFINPRQNFPLPPIPDSAFSSLDPLSNGTNEILTNIVSTTQIEVSRPRPVNSKNLHITSISNNFDTIRLLSPSQSAQQQQAQQSDSSKMPPPPEFILLPPIRPRRRNLSNASTTFSRKGSIISSNNTVTNNISRRRYDPAQLAEDLSKLDIAKDPDVISSPVIETSADKSPSFSLDHHDLDKCKKILY